MSLGCTFTTNSDLVVIGGYFADAVKLRMGCPKLICADLGTENAHLRQMQVFMREDHGDAFAQCSFIYGSSHHNQRIESWWSFLRKHCTQHWMNIFQDLKDTSMYTGDFLDKNLSQFCFMKLIQVIILYVVYVTHTYHLLRTMSTSM